VQFYCYRIRIRLLNGDPDPEDSDGLGQAIIFPNTHENTLNEKGLKFSESHYATSSTKKEGGGH